MTQGKIISRWAVTICVLKLIWQAVHVMCPCNQIKKKKNTFSKARYSVLNLHSTGDVNWTTRHLLVHVKCSESNCGFQFYVLNILMTNCFQLTNHSLKDVLGYVLVINLGITKSNVQYLG